MTEKPAGNRPLWKCPKCGRQFTRPGQSHWCGPFSVDRLLQDKSDQAIGLYRAFEALVNSIGHVMIAPAKTRIGFQNRRIFAAVNRIGESHLDIHIVNSKPIQSDRVRRIQRLSPQDTLNHLRVQDVQELDAELVERLRQGYEWGEE